MCGSCVAFFHHNKHKGTLLAVECLVGVCALQKSISMHRDVVAGFTRIDH